MLIDLKHYIITITAIFISLGIGIFIGFNMNGQELFLEQQQQLVDNLENRFNELILEKGRLESNIERLKSEIDKRDEFIEKAYHEMIHEKLLGLNIAILQTTDHYYYNNVKETLEEAGANVPLHLIFTDKIIYLSENQLNLINEFLGLQLSKEEVLDKINTDIIDFLINNNETNLLNFLISNDFIRLPQYFKLESPIDQVIIAGGQHHKNNQFTTMIDLALIEKLHNENIRTIGVERLDIIHTSIPLYRESGISTVDNVETIIGRISLVYVVSGREGSFGEKVYSEEFVPIGSL